MSILKKSEVFSDNDSLRMDSEYFKKEYLNFFHNVPDLKPLAYFVKEGYRVVYENTHIIDKQEAVSGGYPYFLQATDLETPFIKTDDLFFVNQSEWERYPKGRITRGEILIEVKGKIDKVSIVPEDFPEKTMVSGSLFKLSVNEKISKNVLLSYLISKYGVAFKDRFKSNLLISYIAKPDLYRIPVPGFSFVFQKGINRIFERIFEFRKMADELYSDANEKLLRYLEIDEAIENANGINIKSFKSSFLSTGRLDAEYYQKKYEQTLTQIRRTEHDTLIKLATIKKSIEPGSSNYDDQEGLPFYRISDYSKMGLNQPTKMLKQSFVKNNASLLSDIQPKKGDILFSKDGTVGIAYLLDHEIQGVTSSAILRLTVRDNARIRSEYLTLVLNSILVKMQANRDAGGSIILHWRKEEIEQVHIPILSMAQQTELSQMLIESFEKRKTSEQLLRIAKESIEKYIEQNEGQALNFLNNAINGKYQQL